MNNKDKPVSAFDEHISSLDLGSDDTENPVSVNALNKILDGENVRVEPGVTPDFRQDIRPIVDVFEQYSNRLKQLEEELSDQFDNPQASHSELVQKIVDSKNSTIILVALKSATTADIQNKFVEALVTIPTIEPEELVEAFSYISEPRWLGDIINVDAMRLLINRIADSDSKDACSATIRIINECHLLDSDAEELVSILRDAIQNWERRHPRRS